MNQWVSMNIKCSWKSNMFSEEHVNNCLSYFISLRTNQTKSNGKWVFLTLTGLVPSNHHLNSHSISIPTFGKFSLNQGLSLKCAKQDWLLTNESMRVATDSASMESVCLAATHFRSWAFQVYNFNFPPYPGGYIVINSWGEDSICLLRVGVGTKWECFMF